MQTQVRAPAEASKQQNQSAQKPTQLLAESPTVFEDARPETAQLNAMQSMMGASQQNQNMLALQARMNISAQAQNMQSLQMRMAAGALVQSRAASAFESAAVQRVEEEPLPAKPEGETAQREAIAAASSEPTAEAPKPNNTGLPNQLKAGIESLSGMSMDHVKVHYNSDKPTQLQAHAYAQGSEIHVAPGQEQHLPHEAWHVVQQAQGRVRPTMQMKGGVDVNDDAGLEAEADVMGARALGQGVAQAKVQMCNAMQGSAHTSDFRVPSSAFPLQMQSTFRYTHTNYNYYNHTDHAQRNQRVGIGMEAWLDPNAPVKGSATGDPQKEFIRHVRRTFPNDNMIRGHLLNHDLGGYGVEENLFPITSAANGVHLRTVEYGVKNALVTASGTGQGVYYRVNVTGAMDDLADNPVSRFECQAQYVNNVDSLNIDGDEILRVNVTSSPQKSGPKRAYDQRGSAAAPDGSAVDNFDHSSGLATWKHGARKGALDFYTKANNGDVAITDAHIVLGDGTAEAFFHFIAFVLPEFVDLLDEENGLFEWMYPAFEAAFEGEPEDAADIIELAQRFCDELDLL